MPLLNIPVRNRVPGAVHDVVEVHENIHEVIIIRGIKLLTTKPKPAHKLVPIDVLTSGLHIKASIPELRVDIRILVPELGINVGVFIPKLIFEILSSPLDIDPIVP